MAKLLITYDLKKTKDYPRLWEALKAVGACKALLSVWVVDHATSTCKQMRDHLVSFIDNDDVLFVAQLQGDWASHAMPPAQLACVKAQVHQ